MNPRVFIVSILFLKIALLTVFLGGFYRVQAASFFFCADVLIAFHIFAPRAQWMCPVVTHFETAEKEIWLTIDDGPDAEDAPRILDLLDAHGAKATFFHIGDRVPGREALVRETVERGHEVGCHTLTHPVWTFWAAWSRRTAREVGGSHEALRRCGITPRYFRTPVGFKNFFLHAELEKLGTRAVAWTLRSGDVYGRSPAEIVRRLEPKLAPGAILLMHEGAGVPPANRVKAIEAVLEMLDRRGYKCVLPREATLRPRFGSGVNERAIFQDERTV